MPAIEGSASHAVTVLDGDPYQPVWFDWLYPEEPFAPWSYVLDYFEQRPERALMLEFYVHMMAGEDERTRRDFQREAARGHDLDRAQAKYDRYFGMTVPQTAYFEAMGDAFPGSVMHHETVDYAATAACIFEYEYHPVSAKAVFGFMRTWLTEHGPSEFAQ